MIPHPTTIQVVTELRRQEFLATAGRERQAATAAGAVLPWRQLAVCALTLVALALGFGV
jgi:hypothetical protein